MDMHICIYIYIYVFTYTYIEFGNIFHLINVIQSKALESRKKFYPENVVCYIYIHTYIYTYVHTYKFVTITLTFVLPPATY